MTTNSENGGAVLNDQRPNETMDDMEVVFEISPFGIAPDARMIFVHPHFDSVRKGLLNTILLDNGFGVVTGEVGSGKTTLLHRVIADLPPDFEVAMIMNTCLKPDELLHAIADDLGMPARPDSTQPEMERRQLLSAIGARLAANNDAGRRTIIIIDEAQHLSDETLELVRMLSNQKSEHTRVGAGKGVRFLLFGQEQLRERLLRPELQAFVSRIGAQYALNPLSLAETEEYVRHRLVTGRPTRPVTLSEKAVGCLHRASSGLPRRINIVAGKALLLCLSDHRREINTKDVIRAAKASTLPFDRRARERHYTAAAGWILFAALSVFAARQYVRNSGSLSPTASISPATVLITSIAPSIPPRTALESAPIAAETLPVVAELVDQLAADFVAPTPAPVVGPIAAVRVVPVSVAASPVEPTHLTRTLSGNMRGPDVTLLQLRLAQLGYFTVPPTDKFGRATLAALLAFQKDRGISEQGHAGPRTFAALYRTGEASPPSSVRRAQTVAASGDSSLGTSPPPPALVTRSLGGNMRGSDVTRMQMRLAELGYFKETPTDKFGRATQSALTAFQNERGISEHGVAGPKTFAALYGADEESRPPDVR